MSQTCPTCYSSDPIREMIHNFSSSQMLLKKREAFRVEVR